MKKGRCCLIMITLILLGGTGCAGIRDYLGEYKEMVKKKGLSGKYLETIKKWSREKTVYDEFSTRFYIAATYRSEEMIRVFLDEQARLLHLDDTEKNRRAEIQRNVSSEYTSFFFYAYTEDRQANDFSERGSMWRVYLLSAKGNKINPVEIRAVDKITPEIEVFYPYVNRYYGRCYNVKFPRQGEDDVLTLVFTSVLGRADLSWKSAR